MTTGTGDAGAAPGIPDAARFMTAHMAQYSSDCLTGFDGAEDASGSGVDGLPVSLIATVRERDFNVESSEWACPHSNAICVAIAIRAHHEPSLIFDRTQRIKARAFELSSEKNISSLAKMHQVKGRTTPI
jgi:hypothetical protein